MSTRIQALAFGLGTSKQADIRTASGGYARFRKLNAEVVSPEYINEDDANEIGKANEFATELFASHRDVKGKIEKYGSAEFLLWAAAFGLGDGSSGGYTPIDPSTSIELPYFTIVQQLAEGGGQALDVALLGCAVESWEVQFNSAPGRQSVKCTVDVIGSGEVIQPSGMTLPPVQKEHYTLSQSMSLVINGTDYVKNKNIVSGTLKWNNALAANEGYFPGAGLQNGAAIRGRLEAVKRSCSFEFTARLQHNSDEYTKLIGQQMGPMTMKFQYDASNYVQYDFPALSYKTVTNTEAGGIAAVKVVCSPIYDPTSGILTVTGGSGLGISV